MPIRLAFMICLEMLLNGVGIVTARIIAWFAVDFTEVQKDLSVQVILLQNTDKILKKIILASDWYAVVPKEVIRSL